MSDSISRVSKGNRSKRDLFIKEINRFVSFLLIILKYADKNRNFLSPNLIHLRFLSSPHIVLFDPSNYNLIKNEN